MVYFVKCYLAKAQPKKPEATKSKKNAVKSSPKLVKDAVNSAKAQSAETKDKGKANSNSSSKLLYSYSLFGALVFPFIDST